MAFYFTEINKRCCATCQHFDCPRTVKNQSGRIIIEYGETSGICRLAYESTGRRPVFHPAGYSLNCGYRRWIELPD